MEVEGRGAGAGPEEDGGIAASAFEDGYGSLYAHHMDTLRDCSVIIHPIYSKEPTTAIA